ncbi:hypothetical protein ABZ747_17860 [Kitasatospora cineracea]|uniref:hypothetical protein n=1 Tax=Kitasatospora cineracea TaxID=88074 RepID=UPI0033FC3C94
MSAEPESGGEDSDENVVEGARSPRFYGDVDGLVIISGRLNIGSIGIQTVAELVTGFGAAATAASVTVKAKIEAQADVRKAEIEAETRRLEITEETKREQMRLEAGSANAEPASGDQ